MLLILAGISISTIIGQNGILNRAGEAKEDMEIANEKEQIILAVQGSLKNNGNIDIDILNENLKGIAGILGLPLSELPGRVSIKDNTYIINEKGIVSEAAEVGKRVKTTVKDNYEDCNGKFATIPKGFAVSNIEGEQTISTGLVIYDIPEDKEIEWDENLNQYNQFVWIPVSQENYQRSSFGEDLVWAYYKEPDNMANNIIEYESIKANILKYGGFYIARYESAFFVENDKLICKSVPSIKHSEEEWERSKDNNGMLFNYVTWREAMNYSKEMYQNSTELKSNFLFGTQWDSILNWIAEKNEAQIYEEKYGNYSGFLIIQDKMFNIK